MRTTPIVILGAGPAGLSAAYECIKQGIRPLVLEKTDTLGGIARTEFHNGYHFDMGGHRFFTKIDPIQKLWEQMLGDEFLNVSRMSRIYFRDRFFNYPLSLSNAL